MLKRESLCAALQKQLDIFQEYAEQNFESEQEMAKLRVELWQTCTGLLHIADSIHTNLQTSIEFMKSDIKLNDFAQEQLLNEHGELMEQLESARSLSRSIVSRSSIIRSRRVFPIMKLLWIMSEKNVNAQRIAEYEQFMTALFDILNRSDSRESVNAALGLLGNVCSTFVGINSIANHLQEVDYKVFEQIFEVCQKYQEYKTHQLALYLISNLTESEDLLYSMIREGIVGFMNRGYAKYKQNKNDQKIFDCLIEKIFQSSYFNTLNQFAQNDAHELFCKVNQDSFDTKVSRAVNEFIDFNNPQSTTTKRFGVKRIYH